MGTRLSSPRPAPGSGETREILTTCTCGTCTTCTRKTSAHLVNELQLWIRNGRLNSQDHGEQPLRNDREDNDLVDELQLRNFHSFLRDDTTHTRDHGDFLNKLQLWDSQRPPRPASEEPARSAQQGTKTTLSGCGTTTGMSATLSKSSCGS